MNYDGAVMLKRRKIQERGAPEFETSRRGEPRLRLDIDEQPFPMPGGFVQWNIPRRGSDSARLYNHFVEGNDGLTSLNDYTRLTTTSIKAERQGGNSVGFTVGLLTSSGAKWLNWAMLDANTQLMQTVSRFPVFSTCTLSIPVEMRFSPPKYGDEQFGLHHDQEVAALGNATLNTASYELTLGPRPANPGYLFVTKNAFRSYGTRREIEMAITVNAAAHEAGETKPRIIMRDVRHTLRHARTPDDMRAVMIFNVRTVKELTRLARDLVAFKETNPEYHETVHKGLTDVNAHLSTLETLVHPLSETVTKLDPKRRAALDGKTPELTAEVIALPQALSNLKRGIEQLVA